MKTGTAKELDVLERMISEVEDYAILILDQNGLVQSWNNGARKIKGYKRDEIIGRSFVNFYTPEEKKINKPQQLLEHAINNKKAVDEGWRVRKDGTRFWANVTITAIHDNKGNVTGFGKVTRDLTTQKKSEEQLQLLNKAVNELDAYAIILLDENGTVINWNKGAENIKGYTSEEIIGQNFRQFYTQEDRDNKRPDNLLNEAIKFGYGNDEGWRVKKESSLFLGKCYYNGNSRRRRKHKRF